MVPTENNDRRYDIEKDIRYNPANGHDATTAKSYPVVFNSTVGSYDYIQDYREAFYMSNQHISIKDATVKYPIKPEDHYDITN
jgi:hypothetical protein